MHEFQIKGKFKGEKTKGGAFLDPARVNTHRPQTLDRDKVILS